MRISSSPEPTTTDTCGNATMRGATADDPSRFNNDNAVEEPLLQFGGLSLDDSNASEEDLTTQAPPTSPPAITFTVNIHMGGVVNVNASVGRAEGHALVESSVGGRGRRVARAPLPATRDVKMSVHVFPTGDTRPVVSASNCLSLSGSPVRRSTAFPTDDGRSVGSVSRSSSIASARRGGRAPPSTPTRGENLVSAVGISSGLSRGTSPFVDVRAFPWQTNGDAFTQANVGAFDQVNASMITHADVGAFPQASTASTRAIIKDEEDAPDLHEDIAAPDADHDAARDCRWYVVTSGRRVGIYKSWEEAKVLVTGVRSNCHKSYAKREDAVRNYYAAKDRNEVVVRV
ncbi:uncharacterized protein BXZ73DRAFT_82965 [Epithele typhae]|uniref:uncharacterized protein n=1 Tax=Epithele typhae TaxID=378194 RepID=UPI0020088FF1|nr:uncharacterized protein BXZ73DRAFT_82965 [Epithele typhae]KAH9911154.1 hypothetical protein BXZ73DRAFT_82965 [Epithele typhae]